MNTRTVLGFAAALVLLGGGVELRADDEDDGPLVFERFEVPEDVAFRGHPFIRTVEEANAKGVFSRGEEDALRRAEAARAETERHVERLRADRAYRVGDRKLANAAHDEQLRDKHLRFLWREPYALVWVADEPLDDHDAQRAKVALHEMATLLTKLYRHVLTRFGASHGLSDLMEPGGGRADEGPAPHFRDGIPLLVLVFETAVSNVGYARGRPWARDGGDPTAHVDAVSGALRLTHYPCDSPLATAAFQAYAAGGAGQLLYWFTRQTSRWRLPRHEDGAIRVGLSEWLGDLRPSGSVPPHLCAMQGIERTLEERAQAYPLFPLERLLSFSSFGAAGRWGGAEWGFGHGFVLQLYRQQAWAFVHFLDTYEGGTYRPLLDRFVEAQLGRRLGEGLSGPLSRRLLGIHEEEDWESLEREWRSFVLDDLMERSLQTPRAEERPDLRIELTEEQELVVHAPDDEGGWRQLAKLDTSPFPVEELREVLLGATSRVEREEDGASSLRLVVEGGRSAKWQLVQWVMQVAGEPEIRIYKMQFRVRGRD